MDEVLIEMIVAMTVLKTRGLRMDTFHCSSPVAGGDAVVVIGVAADAADVAIAVHIVALPRSDSVAAAAAAGNHLVV